MGRVWVLGSLNMDTTYLVKQLPREGMTVSARDSFKMIGGKGMNQAAAAAWFDADVHIIGAIGKDADGKKIRDFVEKRKISGQYLYELDANTGNAVIFVENSGANMIVVEGGANQQVPKKPVDIRKGDFLAAQLETNLDAVCYYFRSAHTAGAMTVLNPSPIRQLPEELLELTDILVANEHEMCEICGCLESEIPHLPELLENPELLKGKTVIVTLGADGALYRERGTVRKIDGWKVPVMDTQGAGDAFLGAFLAKLAAGDDFSEAVTYGNLVGACCVSKHGTTTASLPSGEEVEKLRSGCWPGTGAENEKR